METKLLLPHRYKFVGWALVAGAMILWTFTAVFDMEFTFFQGKMFALLGGVLLGKTVYFSIVDLDMTNTVMGSVFIVGGLMVAFSREKIEDEFIMGLRLSSFKWAVLINYVILLLLFIFVHGIAFLGVMVYNMFTVLIFFILRFHYLLVKNRVRNHEK